MIDTSENQLRYAGECTGNLVFSENRLPQGCGKARRSAVRRSQRRTPDLCPAPRLDFTLGHELDLETTFVCNSYDGRELRGTRAHRAFDVTDLGLEHSEALGQLGLSEACEHSHALKQLRDAHTNVRLPVLTPVVAHASHRIVKPIERRQFRSSWRVSLLAT